MFLFRLSVQSFITSTPHKSILENVSIVPKVAKRRGRPPKKQYSLAQFSDNDDLDAERPPSSRKVEKDRKIITEKENTNESALDVSKKVILGI